MPQRYGRKPNANPFNAAPEILAAVVIGAWTLSFGVKMLFESRQAMEDRAEA